MSDLHNESIFITGGGSGLGLALVERFIEEGAQVATLELSAAKVASLRQRFGEHILAVEGNVTCYADYQRAVDQILTRSGKLDCFIGNAGIWDHNASLVNTPAETLETGFHELFNVNVLGYLLGYGIGKVLKLNTTKCRAISIEVGMQNSGLATSLATTHFAAYPLATIPGAVFSVWHNISGAILANFFVSMDAKKKEK